MLNKIWKALKNPKIIFWHLIALNIFPISDEKYLKITYKCLLNKKLNLDNPITFNEKLQWLKLYNRKIEYRQMVDKAEVKEYVSKKIGPEYIIPTFGVYNSFEEINFDKLPNQFVIKCTHDSGGVVICKDKRKINYKMLSKKIKKSLKRKYFYRWREWPYKDVIPRIIVEKFMQDDLQKSMVDYKVHCFNGVPEIILVCTDRNKDLKETFFDTSWKLLPIKRPGHQYDSRIKRPKNLDLMLKLAETLSNNIPFVRVDFYEINGKVFFGELTFFPAAGFKPFEPDEWDEKLGKMIKLPTKNQINLK